MSMTLSFSQPQIRSTNLNSANKGIKIQKLTVLRAPVKKAEGLWHDEFLRYPRPSPHVYLDIGSMCI
ncbi:hypothetical protein HNQ34_002523 [Anoxybacillus tepidamans]|uniref:Uncharacterized protein n=1 Tax=Anoxybacteroides tepidamans TaxID=265948 RepID=A0A7W8MVB6_9BACL|nr:hypothetical protein [Anoxybacillus tepidamans]MBB5325422.1 hypothetical protein [Anoxybacillus tepidamans]